MFSEHAKSDLVRSFMSHHIIKSMASPSVHMQFLFEPMGVLIPHLHMRDCSSPNQHEWKCVGCTEQLQVEVEGAFHQHQPLHLQQGLPWFSPAPRAEDRGRSHSEVRRGRGTAYWHCSSVNCHHRNWTPVGSSCGRQGCSSRRGAGG